MAHCMQERESEVYDEFFATTEDEYILNARENPKSKLELINFNQSYISFHYKQLVAKIIPNNLNFRSN